MRKLAVLALCLVALFAGGLPIFLPIIRKPNTRADVRLVQRRRKE